jgi:hypothetical protein
VSDILEGEGRAIFNTEVRDNLMAITDYKDKQLRG